MRGRGHGDAERDVSRERSLKEEGCLRLGPGSVAEICTACRLFTTLTLSARHGNPLAASSIATAFALFLSTRSAGPHC